MSVPANPLDAGASTSHLHVLVAFKYAQDALEFDDGFDPGQGTIGGEIDGMGPNVVVVNEFLDQTFSINEAVWGFDFIPDVDVSTTSTVGKLVIGDQFVPYSFIEFLGKNVIDVFNETEEPSNLMSLSHATFAFKTYFIVGGLDNSSDIIQTKPFFFNIDTIESVPTKSGFTAHRHIINAIGVSNSLGLLRSFSSLYQMNITHKDGNIHDTIPQGTGVGNRLRTRADENSSNSANRKNRLDKSKPMTTLKDIFDGLEADLNQQRYLHKGQVQEWNRVIRDDSVDKIIIAPKQKKLPTPEELPLKFKIDLDPIYHSYKVDNRNMPFEQPRVNQGEVGITSFAIKPGETIYHLIDRLMVLSTKSGEDATANPKKSHKVTITPIRTTSDVYIVNIKIRQYTIPSTNVNGEDTGEDSEQNYLHFFINDRNERDVDILSMKSIIAYAVGNDAIERSNIEQPGYNIIFGDREQITGERKGSAPFFQTMFSGIRPMLSSHTVDGVENGRLAANYHQALDPYTLSQTTEYELIIRGNPLLLSDVARNPNDVVDDEDSGANYYNRPEIDPMYLRFTIYLNSYDDSGNNPERFYYDGFYHIIKVVNNFSMGSNGNRAFYQHLMLRRTDNLI